MRATVKGFFLKSNEIGYIKPLFHVCVSVCVCVCVSVCVVCARVYLYCRKKKQTKRLVTFSSRQACFVINSLFKGFNEKNIRDRYIYYKI